MNHLDNLGRLLSPLLDDRNNVLGITHLAKIARVPEARGRRDLSDAEEWLGGKVVATQNRRLHLTESGAELARLLGELDDLRSRVLAGSRTEVLAVDCEPALAPLLARCFADIFAAFGDSVRIEVQPFDAVSLRERLEAVPGSLGLGWCAEENSTTVALPARVRWVVLFPDGHAAPKREVSPADLATLPRLFVAAEDERDPALAPLFALVPPARRVTLPWSGAVLASVQAGSGCGLTRAFPWEAPFECHAVPLAGVEALRPALFLPRKASALTETASTLIAALKRRAAEPYTPPALVADTDAELPAAVSSDLVSA